MKFIIPVLFCTCAGLFGLPQDSAWVSYYNGADGWFAFQGPQRAMRLNPADFGLECPLQVESLKTWWYWGMGSREDTWFTFRIYAGDGSTLLWESESLFAPASNWTYYGLSQAVVIDSGTFYIATTHRLVNPWAHPYVNVDTGPTAHSFYGSPGNWTLDDVGEFCFFAYVREIQTGVDEGRWAGATREKLPQTIVRAGVPVTAGEKTETYDIHGRRVAAAAAGPSLKGLAPGVYFNACRKLGVRKLVVVR